MRKLTNFIKKHKTKIIVAAVVAAMLAAAWIYGGNYPRINDVATADMQKPSAPTTINAPTASPHENPPEPAQNPSQNPSRGAIPDDAPEPVEPQDAAIGDGSFAVTLTVRCDAILNNIGKLNREKRELVPDDGIIFATANVAAYEGESVFNILQRTMKQNRIHMAFRNTPIYNSAYIEAINNLYEFDVGELSGWMYCVNNWYPNYGCSRYQLKPGDAIEWNYTCDLGRDLGQEWVDQNDG